MNNHNKYVLPEGSLISYFSTKVKKYGGINFAQGIPGFNPPKELLESLNKLIYTDIHQYAPGTGDPELTQTIINHYNHKYKTNFSDANILITTGATEAISLLFTYLWHLHQNVLNVLSFNPAYESYRHLPRIYHCNHYSFDLSNNQNIDFDKLRTFILTNKIKLVFVSSPGNPFGKVWSKNEYQHLVKLSNELNFYIIADSVYNELYFEIEPFNPISEINNNIFYVNSFSKMFSITGWRIGYLICDTDHIKKIISVHDYTGLTSPSILQKAIARYLNENDYGKEYLNSLRKKAGKSFDLIHSELIKLGFKIPQIDAGYFIWAKLPNIYQDGFKFAVDLYEKTKVAVVPGIHFSTKAENYIRINIARKEEEVLEGIKQIKTFFEVKE